MLQAVVAVALLAGNFFFVAVEFAIASARPTMVDELVRKGARGARSFQHAVEHIDNYLSACQLGITICSIGLGITAEPLITHAFERVIGFEIFGLAAATLAFVLAYGLVSMFHVVLGELAPKSLAIARTGTTGLALIPPMRVFYLATKPVVDLFNAMGNLILRPFGIPPASEAAAEPHSERELEALIAESERRGLIEPEERAFARGAFRFGDLRAREVMVPRDKVVSLSAEQPLREAVRDAAASGLRRLPVCEPSRGLDDPAGFANLSDLAHALASEEQTGLAELARPLMEISDATLLDDLLKDMRARREHLALVRDEHGTALGIITLEDIVEQVIGDIRDEFDPETEPPIEPSEDGFRVPGDAHLHHLAHKLDIEFGEHRQSTVGGFIVERLGHVPHVGEEIEIDGATPRAARVERTLVTDVVIARDVDAGDPDPPPAEAPAGRDP